MFIEGLFFQLFLSDSSLDTWSTEHERMVPSVWIIWLHQPFWTATHVKCGGKRRLLTEVWTWYQCLAWPMMSRWFLNRLICIICSLPLISPLLHRNPPWLADSRKVPFAQIFCTEARFVCTGTHTDKVKEECIEELLMDICFYWGPCWTPELTLFFASFGRSGRKIHDVWRHKYCQLTNLLHIPF